MRHLKQIKMVQSDNHTRTVTIKIEDIDVKVEPDSGAEVNVMDEHQFKVLENRCQLKPTLESS